MIVVRTVQEDQSQAEQLHLEKAHPTERESYEKVINVLCYNVEVLLVATHMHNKASLQFQFKNRMLSQNHFTSKQNLD